MHGLQDAIGGVGEPPILLVWRHCRRHEEHAVEPGLFPATIRRDQVADVHRIETAAKHTNSHG